MVWKVSMSALQSPDDRSLESSNPYFPSLPPIAKRSPDSFWKFSSLPEEWNTASLGWMEKRKHSPVNVITVIKVSRGLISHHCRPSRPGCHTRSCWRGPRTRYPQCPSPPALWGPCTGSGTSAPETVMDTWTIDGHNLDFNRGIMNYFVDF